MLEVAEDFLLHVKQQVILYADDAVNYGPWNQVVYDYRPAFLTALKYCWEKGYRKFFLAGDDCVTHTGVWVHCLRLGENWDFPIPRFMSITLKTASFLRRCWRARSVPVTIWNGN